MAFDPRHEIRKLPLEQLVEIHVSGCDMQEGIVWDDHASFADETVFELLDLVLRSATPPKAITFEYNWEPYLPDRILSDQIARVKEMVS